jgi:hypothetical protein
MASSSCWYRDVSVMRIRSRTCRLHDGWCPSLSSSSTIVDENRWSCCEKEYQASSLTSRLGLRGKADRGTSPFDVGIRAHIYYFVGRFVIKGTCTSPKTGAHVANNINIALQVFREWRDMPTRHLYDIQAVKNGLVDVIVGLVQDIMSTVLRPAANKTGQVDLSKTKSLSNSCNQNLASAQSTISHPSASSPHHNIVVPTKDMCTAEKAKSAAITKRAPPLNFLQAKAPPPFNFQKNKHRPIPLITSEQKRAVKIWLHDLGMDPSKLLATRSGCTGNRSPTHILDDPLRNGSLYCKLLLRMGLARKGDLKVGKNAHLHLAKKDTSLKDAFAYHFFSI